MHVLTRHAYHRCVLRVIERVIHSPDRLIGLAELAAHAGFSRHHLNRLFSECIGESLGEFARRIRLERAACCLRSGARPVADLAFEAGYSTPEAFARAFRLAYGIPPSEYRSRSTPWQLAAPTGIHWSEPPALLEPKLSASEEFVVNLTSRSPLHVAVLRHEGGYGDIPRAWERLQSFLPGRPWEQHESGLLAIYHDDGKLPAGRKPQRADVGYIISPDETPPPGMKRLVIPGGKYAATERLAGPNQHVAAWDMMNGLYIPKRGRRPRNIPGIDEYFAWPLPWHLRQARVLIGLEIEMDDA